MSLFFFFVILFYAYSKIINVDPSLDDIVTKVSSSDPNDVIYLSAGTFDLTSILSIDVYHNITIIGRGIDVTTLKYIGPESGFNFFLKFWFENTEAFLRVSNFTLQSVLIELSDRSFFLFTGESYNIRVDHIKFDRLPMTALEFSGSHFGVVDNCQFIYRDENEALTTWSKGLIINHQNYLGLLDYGDYSWTKEYVYGSGNAIFVEDSYFERYYDMGGGDYDHGNALLTCQGGGRVVVRNNVFNASSALMAGTDYNGRLRACFAHEIYGNKFICDNDCSTFKPSRTTGIFVLGGHGWEYDNQIQGSQACTGVYDNYRSDDDILPFRRCCPSNGWDKVSEVLYSGVIEDYNVVNHNVINPADDYTASLFEEEIFYDITSGNSYFIYDNGDNYISLEDIGTDPDLLDEYQVVAMHCFDQVGSGKGDMISIDTPEYPNQEKTGCYNWGNKLNGIKKEFDATAHKTIEDNTYNLKPSNFVSYDYPHPFRRLFIKEIESKPEFEDYGDDIDDTSLLTPQQYWIVYAVSGGLLLLCVIIICLIIVGICGCCCYKKMKNKKGGNDEEMDQFDAIDKEKETAAQKNFKIDPKLFTIELKEMKLKREIGSGGSNSTIYLAEWNGQRCAFKVFKTQDLLSEENYEEFESEIKIISNISHPNVIRFFGACFKSPRVGLVINYCEFGDLISYFSAHRASVPEKLLVLHGICAGMEFLHSRNIIHRDLKSKNVLIDAAKVPKIIDFGLSKLVNKANSRSGHTRGVGTSYYMAPEIILGQDYDEKVDVFSYSMIIFEVMSEVFNPYIKMVKNNDLMGVEYRIANNEDFRPVLSRKNITLTPPWLVNIMKSSWKIDPRERSTFTQIRGIFKRNNVK